MKKILLSCLTLLLFVGSTMGQEDPKKAMKKAASALANFMTDQEGKADKYDEALSMIKIAANDAEYGKVAKTWITYGEILAAKPASVYNQSILDPTLELDEATIATTIDASQKLIKAVELAEKAGDKTKAVNKLKDVGNYLQQWSNVFIQLPDYPRAYETLNATIPVREALVGAGTEDFLFAEDDYNNHKFITAFTGIVANEKDRAKELLEELYTKEYKESSVYAQYFNLLSEEGNNDKALEVLEKGRAMFPDDSEILFAEINYYIKEQNFPVLEEKLKAAIAAEPNNPSIYSALGNVYMNLFTSEFKAGKAETADDYFNKALEYYNKAVELNPDQFDAVYSIGSLYFNKAVETLKKQNDLGLSKEDQKLFDQYEAESTALFEKALPLFKKAESMNPNDVNTLIALKEIFARMNDFEKSNEFKGRLDTVQGGGTVESSYFN